VIGQRRATRIATCVSARWWASMSATMSSSDESEQMGARAASKFGRVVAKCVLVCHGVSCREGAGAPFSVIGPTGGGRGQAPCAAALGRISPERERAGPGEIRRSLLGPPAGERQLGPIEKRASAISAWLTPTGAPRFTLAER